jgi:hypothetical protein
MEREQLLRISARSKRQAMEWGLVLASQGIEAVIDNSGEGWGLLVEWKDFDRAQASLKQYRLENRGWQWRQPMPETGLFFHWGSVGWVASIVAFYYWSAVRFSWRQERRNSEQRESEPRAMVANMDGYHVA